MSLSRPNKTRRTAAITLMEVLVGVAILIVLVSIAYPIYATIQTKKYRAVALQKMQKFGEGLKNYVTENNGKLPLEEAENGRHEWSDTASPAADRAWYNALPRKVGEKGVGDYRREHNEASMYTEGSLFFFPGADYPGGKKMDRPIFAVAFNSKLQRKAEPKNGDNAGPSVKPEVNISSIAKPASTVALFEQGLRGEKRPFEGIGKYDGDSCKGNAKDFVARYRGYGIMVFVDGHADAIKPSQVIDMSRGHPRIAWNAADAANIFWCPDVNEDPN